LLKYNIYRHVITFQHNHFFVQKVKYTFKRSLPGGNIEPIVVRTETGDLAKKRQHIGGFYLQHRKGTMIMRIKHVKNKNNIFF